ncbi:MAG: hypothetical protein GF309_10450 [Candidatus Lokiarchaeota archaeon]|nr:hypothetical protein [Candidatus Lokiarchaeota archaeon]
MSEETPQGVLGDEQSVIQHESTEILERQIRVAIYNSTNTTTPSYAEGYVQANYSSIHDLLLEAGFDVTRITSRDIADYKLQPSRYDILVLADNVPLTNETDIVKDFWLGGGGILSFDTAASYLCYEGILPREAEGTDGCPNYFGYPYNSFYNITARHPVTQSYELDDSITIPHDDWAAYNWSALQESSLADDVVRLVTVASDDNEAYGVACDPFDMGGKVVHLGIPMGDQYPTDFDEMIIDAVEWICPTPKGRVAFDFSHRPYYGIDSWDAYCDFAGKYTELRNDIVSRGYTFDKLYPSPDGNLTADRLEAFDVLILEAPTLNYTEAEVAAVDSWVDSGGGLYILSDSWGSMNEECRHLQYLMSSYDFSIYERMAGFTGTVSEASNHQTTEYCTSLSLVAAGFLNLSGDAVSVWEEGADTFAAADPHGNGRILVISDIHYATDTYIDDSSNREYTFNVINWLSSDDAEVLIFTNEPEGELFWTGKSIHAVQTPVARAANELGISFVIHSEAAFFNRSLRSRFWDLVVFDCPTSLSVGYIDDIEWYVETGGALLMNYWGMFNIPSHSLWPKLGINYTGRLYNPTPVYPWEDNHPLFTIPTQYKASNYSGPRDYGTTGTLMEAYDNATVLAGITESPEETTATLVLRNDGKTLYNSYLTDQYAEDIDDSTYEDRLELWLNELAFMLRPEIDSPSDAEIEFGTTGENVVWDADSYKPRNYVLEENGVVIRNCSWNGEPISLSLDGYAVGTYSLAITVIDEIGETASDMVEVTVVDTTKPTIDGPSDMEFVKGETGNVVNWSISDLRPAAWELFINGTSNQTGTWSDGDELSFNVDNFEVGSHHLVLTVHDESGNYAIDVVIVTVLAESAVTTTTTTTTSTGTTTTTQPTTTTTTNPTSTTEPTATGLPQSTLIVLAVSGAVICVLLIVIVKQR